MTIGVTGAGGGVGYAVVESLRRAPGKPEIVGFDASPSSASMATLPRRALLPRVGDVNEYSAALLSAVERHEVSVLVPGLDTELPVISGLRSDLLARGCSAVVSDAAVTALSADKLEFSRFAVEHNLPVAQARSLVDARSNIEDVAFPVIVKPVRGSGSQGVRLIRSAEELGAIVDDGTLITQEYLAPRRLDGQLVVSDPHRLDQSHELSVQVILNPEGRELGRFASLNRLKDGVPVDVEPVTQQIDLSGASRLIESLVPLGARGPINLQGRIGADGTPVYFELNARFTGITSLRGLMGFREVEAVVDSFGGGARLDAQSVLRTRTFVHGFRPVGDIVVAADRLEPKSFTSGHTRSLGRVAVTGASGYLGATLSKSLADCDDVESVIALSGARPESWPGLLSGADTLVHLAGRRPDAGGSFHEFVAANVELTERLMHLSADLGISRVVLASTQAVYGLARDPLWTEPLAPQPETIYGASKWSAELIGRVASTTEMEVVSLRFARLFGAGPCIRWSELPHAWSRAVALGDKIVIHGTGEQRMDLVNVRDAAQAIVDVGRSRAINNGEAINIGGGKPISLNELAGALVQVGRTRGLSALRVERVESSTNPTDFGMAIDRAFEVANWKPATPLRESLEQLIDFAIRQSRVAG